MTGLPQVFVTFASVLSATALNALWQDALLVVSIWLLLRLWPRINAATRYTVWSATLIAALIIPVATTLAFFAPPQPPQATSSSAPALSSIHRTAQAKRIAVPRSPQSAAVSRPAPQPLPQRLRVTLPLWLSLTVSGLWLLLAASALLKLTVGLIRLEQLKRDALPLSVEYRDAMPQWIRANKGARDVRLCVSDETDVPVAVGLFDAMILVPHSLLDRLSEGEVDQICLHELAHLRRADDWSNGFQRLIIGLLGWNPAALFVGQQLDLEREVACDDWVLSFVGMVRPYALCLTKMAERASWPRHPIPAPGVFATRKHISLRIERLLGAGRNVATNLSPAPAIAAVAAASALALAITVVAPSVAAPEVAVATSRAVPALKPAPQHEKTRTIVREVRVATNSAANARKYAASTEPAQPLPSPQPRIHPHAMTPPRGAPQATIAHLTVPHYTAPNVTVPHVTVPRVDYSRLAQTLQKVQSQVAQNAVGAVGAARIAAAGHTCSGCDFGKVDWSGRDMHGVDYIGVDLSGAKLVGTNFSGGSFNGVDFSGANLHGASFRNARMTGCDFNEADLTGVDFTGARISGCQFTGARMQSASVRDILNSCSGCDFSKARLAGLDLSNVRANGDDFSAADLRGVNLAGAQLTGIDFSAARMDGANLAGATLNGCNLDGVDLTHVDLSRTKMIGTDFSRRRSPR